MVPLPYGDLPRPAGSRLCETPYHRQVLRDLRSAIHAGNSIAFPGVVGSGTTLLLRQLEADLVAETLVTVPKSIAVSKDRGSLTTFITDLFYDFSPEKDPSIPAPSEHRERALRNLVRRTQRPRRAVRGRRLRPPPHEALGAETPARGAAGVDGRRWAGTIAALHPDRSRCRSTACYVRSVDALSCYLMLKHVTGRHARSCRLKRHEPPSSALLSRAAHPLSVRPCDSDACHVMSRDVTWAARMRF